MKNKSDSGKIKWHCLLGGLFEELLVPLGVSVYPEISVMSQSPVADLVLLKKKRGAWTSGQLERLPDGIRETRAKHVLIEFKYTESVGEDTFRQIIGYEFFYRSARKLDKRDIQPFVVSSKTPGQSMLGTFGYCTKEKSGVYYSERPLLKNLPLLSLNDLSDELHNAFVKCFASRLKNKRSAFKTLARHGLDNFQKQTQWFIEGLWHYWFDGKGDAMKPNEITPETIKEMGKMLEDFILSNVPLEKRLDGLTMGDLLSKFTKDDLLSEFTVNDVLSKFTKDDLLSEFTVNDVLSKFTLDDLLSEFGSEEIEARLRKIKKSRREC